MSVHDWTRVEAGIFHDFHVAWIPEIRNALNGGLLPEGFYALAEQHAGHVIADLLTLHASPAFLEPLPLPPGTGGTAVAEAPPRVERRETVEPAALARRRSLAIRHVSGHRLVALLEIVSPANKGREKGTGPICRNGPEGASHKLDLSPFPAEQFAAKAVEAWDAGIHLLLVDLFPPGPGDPDGMHGLVRRRLERWEEPYALPADRPLTLASYAVGPQIEIYLEHLAVGARLPEMPLFLSADRYVNVPLEATYQEAYRGMPAFWRDVLEGRGPS
jgi:hypothetical protein